MKTLFAFLRGIISLALLAALVWIMRDKLAAIGGIIAGADKLLVLLCFILIVIGITMQSYRLKFLLDAQKIHLKAKDLVSLTFIGHFFNNFMPTAIGGDVIKAYYVSNGTEKKLETFASVVIDRMLGIITLMWIALAAFAIQYRQIENKIIIVIIAVVFAGGIVSMGLVFNERMSRVFLFLKRLCTKTALQEKMQRLYEATNKYRHHKALVFNALGLSLAAQFVYFFMTYLLAISIGSNVPFACFLLALPAISTVSMLPSINGLGIRESGFVYFLGGVMGKEKAFALSLLYLGLILAIGLLGGVVFLFKKEFKHMVVSRHSS